MRYFIAFILLLLTSIVPVHAQSLNVATWNVEWLGSTAHGPNTEATQIRNVVHTITSHSDIALWALQEIDNISVVDILTQKLGSQYGILVTPTTRGFLYGFVYKRSIVEPVYTSNLNLERMSPYFSGRPPFHVQFSLIDTHIVLNVVTVHMKCCMEGYDRRVYAATLLKDAMDTTFQNTPVLVLGDFNDDLVGSMVPDMPTPYTAFLDDPTYQFTTLPLAQRGEHTWCGNAACSKGSILDHILISDELFPAYIAGSTTRLVDVLTDVPGYVSVTSDHIPVTARFEF